MAINIILGDEHTNLVLAWHGGATESVCMKIGIFQFLHAIYHPNVLL
jgi:hypothetical protein